MYIWIQVHSNNKLEELIGQIIWYNMHEIFGIDLFLTIRMILFQNQAIGTLLHLHKSLPNNRY